MCLAAALAFVVLGTAIIRADGSGSPVAAAIGRNVKPHVSLVFYAAAAGLAFVGLWISYAPFAAGRDVVRAAPPPQPMRALPAPVGRDDLAAPHLPGHRVEIIEGQLSPVSIQPAYDGGLFKLQRAPQGARTRIDYVPIVTRLTCALVATPRRLPDQGG